MSKHIYYYEKEKVYYYITDDNDDIQTIHKVNDYDKVRKMYKHKIFGNLSNSLEGLLEFREEYNKMNDDITGYKVKSFTYEGFKKSKNEELAVMHFFKCCQFKMSKIEFEDVKYGEFILFEKCYNGGLIKLNDKYKDKKVKSYGYDFHSYYPYLLSSTDLKIPMKQGKRKHLKALDYENLNYGIYRVKITSDHDKLKNIFAFNPENTYTHYDILFCYENKDKFNISIELLENVKYNALIYNDEDLLNTKTLFGAWNYYLYHMKTDNPNNKLVKLLHSRLWGYLIQYDRIFKNDIEDLEASYKDDDVKTEFKIIDCKFTGEDERTYELVRSEKPYKYSYARLKPFLTSYGRIYIAKVILNEYLLNNIIRIHTDNITIDKSRFFKTVKTLSKEDKTTGNIEWLHAGVYYNECKKCKKLYNYRTNRLKQSTEKHEC
jgi:hypothetical protein